MNIQNSQFKLFTRLLKYLVPFWDKYLLIILLQMIQGTIHALPVLFLSKLPIFIGTGRTVDYLIFAALILLPSFIFRWVIFDSLLYTLVWVLGLKLSLKFRLDLYRKMNQLSLRFYQSRPVGEHLYRANVDIDSVLPLLNSTGGIPGFISSLYQTALMAWLVSVAGSEILFYLTLVLIPIYFLVHVLYGVVRRLDFQRRARAQEVTAVLRESIAGIRVIKAFNRARNTIYRYFSSLSKYYKISQAAYFMQIFSDQVRVSPIHVLWPLSLPFFAYLGLKEQIPIVTWGSIVFFTRAMLFHLDGSYSFFQKIRLFLVPARRLFDTLDLVPEITELPTAKKISQLRGELEFQNVNFSYDAGFPVLKNISFKIEPGKKVAIIGPSGAGKSTICSLALRLFLPDSGTIEIDGTDVRELNLTSVLEQTGVILQETFLFGGSIRENIRYGNPTASDADVEQAARDAGIHADILEMPGGYEMDVAEGTNLSGGQKQRLAIARALIKPPRLLVLDEATASLDIATERSIIETLRQQFQNISTLIVSHRLAIVADADEIIVLEQGEVVERGTHAELLEKRKLYYKLYQQQTNPQKMEQTA